ncbi:zeta toxin family protein [Paenilisteria newyorkensis]|uniref:zeta toxin family protein n=1 Tax=Listeria newyorkensis TaxID=1497681 RepID=UPI000669D7C3|nr:zeta toxin family protein [Listeria newyorkensis]KMT63289.1 hypothetical protein X559_0362 [Listeria newyorkensis]
MIHQDTKSQFSNNGIYTLTRQQLHQKIVHSLLSQPLNNTLSQVAIILGGGSGAGKTSIAEDIIGTNKFIVIDSDSIKEHIPEYEFFRQKKLSIASDLVHEESSDISKKLLMQAIQKQLPIIYDGTFSNYSKYKHLISRLQQHKYTIQLIVIDVDIQVAKNRVKARFSENKRYVPEKIIESTNKAVAKNFIALKHHVDEYIVLENSQDGKAPNIIVRKDTQCDPIIFNDYAYAVFIKKGRTK